MSNLTKQFSIFKGLKKILQPETNYINSVGIESTPSIQDWKRTAMEKCKCDSFLKIYQLYPMLTIRGRCFKIKTIASVHLFPLEHPTVFPLYYI